MSEKYGFIISKESLALLVEWLTLNKHEKSISGQVNLTTRDQIHHQTYQKTIILFKYSINFLLK